MVVPLKHPKMIIFSRKTHSCWVPPFWETPIYLYSLYLMALMSIFYTIFYLLYFQKTSVSSKTPLIKHPFRTKQALLKNNHQNKTYHSKQVYIVYIYIYTHIYIDSPPPTFPQASTVRWGNLTAGGQSWRSHAWHPKVLVESSSPRWRIVQAPNREQKRCLNG